MYLTGVKPKRSKRNLFAYLCSYKPPKGVTVTGIVTSIKQYGKTEKKNIMKSTSATFLRYEVLEAQ